MPNNASESTVGSSERQPENIPNPDDGNTIAHNALTGVRNEGDGASGGADLTILGNSIFANGTFGIDLTDSNSSSFASCLRDWLHRAPVPHSRRRW